MNIILTGERQIGKSTALGKILLKYNGTASGFKTRFDTSCGRSLYISALDGEKRACAASWENGMPRVDLSAFDETGCFLLKPDASLIVMDELGRFEVKAERFRRAVTARFDGEIPVLAVVRLDAAGWMQELKSRADTTVITVTTDNRDEVPETVLGLLEKQG